MNIQIEHKKPHPGLRYLVVALLAIGLWGGSPGQPQHLFANGASATEASGQKLEFMFVQTADDLKVDTAANKLRLVNVGQQTLYFTDRPVRMAGHMKMADFLKEWTRGKDNFGEDPPNATLSVYEPGQAENTLAVVELTQPAVDGADLVYAYKLIEGTLPKSGGATALFIDWIGPGGGVGPGFHGVGVGLRGPGWR
jgi:hypothetical protein